MKELKRILSLLVVFAMLLSVSAFATDETGEGEEPVTAETVSIPAVDEALATAAEAVKTADEAAKTLESIAPETTEPTETGETTEPAEATEPTEPTEPAEPAETTPEAAQAAADDFDLDALSAIVEAAAESAKADAETAIEAAKATQDASKALREQLEGKDGKAFESLDEDDETVAAAREVVAAANEAAANAEAASENAANAADAAQYALEAADEPATEAEQQVIDTAKEAAVEAADKAEAARDAAAEVEAVIETATASADEAAELVAKAADAARDAADAANNAALAAKDAADAISRNYEIIQNADLSHTEDEVGAAKAEVIEKVQVAVEKAAIADEKAAIAKEAAARAKDATLSGEEKAAAIKEAAVAAKEATKAANEAAEAANEAAEAAWGLAEKKGWPFYAKVVTAKGVIVTARAQAGVFPKGATLTAEDVEAEVVENAEGAENLSVVTAVDISFWLDGFTIQPDTNAGLVDITIEDPNAEVAEDAELTVGTIVDDAVEEIEGATVEGGVAAFEAEHFTVYFVAESAAAPDGAVAQISAIGDGVEDGGKFYADSLEAAIEAAASGATVTLVRDVTLNSQLTIVKNLTLDLNGRTITIGSFAGTYPIAVHAKVTVQATGGGGIMSGTCIFSTAHKDGDLTIEGGRYSTTGGNMLLLSTADANGGWSGGGKITVNGGTFVAPPNAYCLYVYKGGSIIVNGGDFSGKLHTRIAKAIQITNVNNPTFDKTAVLEINGGSYSIAGGTFEERPNKAYLPNSYDAYKTSGGWYHVEPLRADSFTLAPDEIGVMVGTSAILPAAYTLTGEMTWSVDQDGTATENEYVRIEDDSKVYAKQAGDEPVTIYAKIGDRVAECKVVVDNGAVEINGTCYNSWADAYTVANVPYNTSEPVTITLLKDVDLGTGYMNAGNRNIILDLGGHTLSSGNNYVIGAVGNGTLVIQNGTVKGRKYDAIDLWGNSSHDDSKALHVTIGDGAIMDAAYSVYIWGQAGDDAKYCYDVTLDIYGTLTACIFVDGNIGNNATTSAKIASDLDAGINAAPVINFESGSRSTSGGAGVFLNGYGIVNVKDGANLTCGTPISMKSGQLNISGGTLHATGIKKDPVNAVGSGGESSGSAVLVSGTYNKHGQPMKVNISGGTLMSDNYTALLITHSDKDSAKLTYDDLSVEVTGGAFIGAASEPAFIADAKLSGDKVYPERFISGGWFSTPVNPDHVIAGMLPTTAIGAASAPYTVGVPVTASFVNYDGEELYTQHLVSGETPVYAGETPVREATAAESYAFLRWSPALAPMAADTTYTAVFTSEANAYVVRFVDEDGTVLQMGARLYGETPSYDGETPVKAPDARYSYEFAGWTPEVSAVTGEVTYTATYTATELPEPEPEPDPEPVSDSDGGESTPAIAAPATTIADEETPLAETPTTIEDEETPLAGLPTLYADVAETDWSHDAIAYVTELGLMNGTGSDENGEAVFTPTAGTTRGMVATVLMRLDEGKPVDLDSFADVADDAYYAESAAWAVENGVFVGYDDGTFRGDTVVTREQLATVLYRYADSSGLDVSATDDLLRFSDADRLSEYARAAMEWAVAVGLIKGTDVDKLSPDSEVTREQIAEILMRFNELTKATV